MDLNTVAEVCAPGGPWLPGDAWLAGGTYLFSEPQPHVRRLVDLTLHGWEPVLDHGGRVEIAATCTIEELVESVPVRLVRECAEAFLASFKIWHVATVGGNLCNALPAGPMISLTTAFGGECRVVAQDGTERWTRDFVLGAGLRDLGEGEYLRSVTVVPHERTAFRQCSLYGLGRSAALVIGTLGDGFRLTVTASTTRPHVLAFDRVPSEAELSDEIALINDWFDDVHGHPLWRRHMTFRLAEEIRRELS
ncbi:FAD binding domain-containing protein [Lentzea sp. CA-135723]|uniref:FAD binding domain-containing protein n=1 Tax=Lentzea sp. CA-135723 TaxID=3239950 RepID=UPI003D8F184F